MPKIFSISWQKIIVAEIPVALLFPLRLSYIESVETTNWFNLIIKPSVVEFIMQSRRRKFILLFFSFRFLFSFVPMWYLCSLFCVLSQVCLRDCGRGTRLDERLNWIKLCNWFNYEFRIIKKKFFLKNAEKIMNPLKWTKKRKKNPSTSETLGSSFFHRFCKQFFQETSFNVRK